MGLLVVIGVAIWFWVGDPASTVAGWFWPNDAAPWERVDAIYYPDRNDLTDHRSSPGWSSVSSCRSAVRVLAAEFSDASLQRGSYECAVGDTGERLGSIAIYRLTVR